MIYLDTHVVIWLYTGLLEKISSLAADLLNENEIRISPIVRLELQYLYEIQRIEDTPYSVLSELERRIGLSLCDKDFDAIVGYAMDLSWTRDPFDRLIVANAALDENVLLSSDQRIRQHYSLARW